jgi:hypothetical protein
MPFYSTSPAKVYCGHYSTSWEWSWRRKIIKFPNTINSDTCNYTNIYSMRPIHSGKQTSMEPAGCCSPPCVIGLLPTVQGSKRTMAMCLRVATPSIVAFSRFVLSLNWFCFLLLRGSQPPVGASSS